MKNKSFIPILLFILFVIIIIIFIFTFVFGKTDDVYKSEYLNKIGYTYDENSIKKNLTNNTLEDFYNNTTHNGNSNFLEYKYELPTNTFYEKKLNSSNNVISSYTFEYKLYESIINISYEISKNNTSIMINGIYDESKNDLSCNIVNNNNFSSSMTLNDYCKIIGDNLYEFIEEKNIFISDSRFIDILNKEYSDLNIGEE